MVMTPRLPLRLKNCADYARYEASELAAALGMDPSLQHWCYWATGRLLALSARAGFCGPTGVVAWVNGSHCFAEWDNTIIDVTATQFVPEGGGVPVVCQRPVAIIRRRDIPPSFYPWTRECGPYLTAEALFAHLMSEQSYRLVLKYRPGAGVPRVL